MNGGQVVNNGKVAVFACGVQAGLSILDKERNRKKKIINVLNHWRHCKKKGYSLEIGNKNKYCRSDTFYEVIKDYSHIRKSSD